MSNPNSGLNDLFAAVTAPMHREGGERWLSPLSVFRPEGRRLDDLFRDGHRLRQREIRIRIRR